MIQLLSDAIQDKIISSAHEVKYFLLILDCTPDVSHVEQMTVILWFVSKFDKILLWNQGALFWIYTSDFYNRCWYDKLYLKNWGILIY